MVATVTISETNTGSVVTNSITNKNYGSADAVNLTIATYPINRGDYSYEKFNRIYLSALGGSSQIDTFKVWLQGATDTGVIHRTNLTGSFSNDPYHTPINTVSAEAINVSPTSVPGTPNLGKSGANSPLTVGGQYSDYHISQVETQGTALPGDQTAKNWYYQYDEQ